MAGISCICNYITRLRTYCLCSQWLSGRGETYRSDRPCSGLSLFDLSVVPDAVLVGLRQTFYSSSRRAIVFVFWLAYDPAPMTESLSGHLLQLDHWTFLLAFALVSANVVLVERALSAAAALLLAVALCYDAYEFYAE